MSTFNRLWLVCQIMSIVSSGVLTSPAAVSYRDDDDPGETDIGITGMGDEGDDLLLTAEQRKSFFGTEETKSTSRRTAGRSRTIETWPNGVVFYELDPTFTWEEKKVIEDAFKEIQRFTCVKFEPKTANNYRYAHVFGKGMQGCSADLGFKPKLRVQGVTLAPTCRNKGTILHELLHLLGVIHEHNLPNRDDYVTIMWDNINDASVRNFEKDDNYRMYGVPYSYRSIMHYAGHYYSKNGKDTIVAKDPTMQYQLGNRRGLDFKDVMYLNRLYGCADNCPDKTKCGADGILNKNCQCFCKDGTLNCDKTSTPKTSSSCSNKYDNDWECFRSADEGQCHSQQAWMHDNCAMACGLCGGNIPTPGSAPCKNNYEEDTCNRYQRSGNCDSDKTWMHKYCANSCGLCGGTGTSTGKTTGTGTGTGTGTTPGGHTGPCKNNSGDDSSCLLYAVNGKCNSSKQWMERNCFKACGWCS